MSDIDTWQPMLWLTILGLASGYFILSRHHHLRSIQISKIIVSVSILHYAFLFSLLLFLNGEQFPIIMADILELGPICVDVLSLIVIFSIIFMAVFSFGISQISLHLLQRQLIQNSSPSMSKFIKSRFPWLKDQEIIVTKIKIPDTYSFTLLRRSRGLRLTVENIVTISTGMIDLLNDDELESVLAHEYSHVVNHDTRYSHFLFTLAKLMFFDPIINLVKNLMNKKHEFNADLGSVHLVKKPKSLARALAKLLVYYSSNDKASSVMRIRPSLSFFDQDKAFVLERIRRLKSIAETDNLNW